jgi:RHS repeat-associated protein
VPAAVPAGLEDLWEGGVRCGDPTEEQWALTFAMASSLAPEVASEAKVIPYRFFLEDLTVAAKAQSEVPGTTASARASHGSGAVPDVSSGSGTSPSIFGFTGHEMDRETGLVYMKARFYDPEVGSFLSEDPFEGSIHEPASLHPYLYAYANPTVYVDPDGRCVGKLQESTACQAIARGLEYFIAGDPVARAEEEIERREKVIQGRREFRVRTGREPRPDEVVWREGGRALTSDFREIDISGRVEPDHAEWTLVGAGTGVRLAVTSARTAGASTAKQVIAGATQLGDEAAGELLGVSPKDVVDLSRLARQRLAPRVPYDAAAGHSGVTMIGEATDRPGLDSLSFGGSTHRPSTGSPTAGSTVSEERVLDWEAVVPKKGKYAGQARIDHVRLHNIDNPAKPSHGVFFDEGVAVTNEAWARAQHLGLAPDAQGKLTVPMGRQVGWLGGSAGSEAAVPLDAVTIFVVPDTNKLITAYPDVKP